MGLLQALARQRAPQAGEAIDYAGTLASMPRYTQAMQGGPALESGDVKRVQDAWLAMNPAFSAAVLSAVQQYPKKQQRTHTLGAGRR